MWFFVLKHDIKYMAGSVVAHFFFFSLFYNMPRETFLNWMIYHLFATKKQECVWLTVFLTVCSSDNFNLRQRANFSQGDEHAVCHSHSLSIFSHDVGYNVCLEALLYDMLYSTDRVPLVILKYISLCQCAC